jgi:hypothetical protein
MNNYIPAFDQFMKDRELAAQAFVNGATGPLRDIATETVENGKIKATWFVVRGSGTGDLSGLNGEGGFEGQFGKESDGTLDYWFEFDTRSLTAAQIICAAP